MIVLFYFLSRRMKRKKKTNARKKIHYYISNISNQLKYRVFFLPE